MPHLSPAVEAVRERPDDEARWLALAACPQDEGRDNEAAALRCFWPAFRDDVTGAGTPLDESIRQLGRYAKLLGRRARELEERRYGPSE